MAHVRSHKLLPGSENSLAVSAEAALYESGSRPINDVVEGVAWVDLRSEWVALRIRRVGEVVITATRALTNQVDRGGRIGRGSPASEGYSVRHLRASKRLLPRE